MMMVMLVMMVMMTRMVMLVMIVMMVRTDDDFTASRACRLRPNSAKARSQAIPGQPHSSWQRFDRNIMFSKTTKE